jgi:hypothetical protein
MSDATLEEEQLARLAIGGRAKRRQRVSRRVLARMLGEMDEAEGDDAESEDIAEGGDEERRLVRLLIGSRMLRRRRLRRLLLAHLLQEGGGAEEEDEEGEDDIGEEGGDKERRFLRLLTGSRMLRRRRVRRALITHLLSERGEDEAEDESDEESIGEESEDKERRLLRLLIGSRMLRRRRVRRALIAHLLSERGEAGEEEGDEDEGELAEEGGDKERRLMRMLAGGRVQRSKRARRALMAYLLREKEEAA